MLTNLKLLYGSALHASDGDIGHITDFYFDDKSWVIRYVVVDTGSWLSGREVLISPHAFGKLNSGGKTLPLLVTRQKVENSPSIESHKPVSRQYEIEYYKYYGWPVYWNGGAMWGLGGYPIVLPPSKDEMKSQLQPHHREDKHLQSVRAITGYQVKATDGIIGEAAGFMMIDKSWVLRDLVVKAGHWYAGKEVLIPTANIQRISYEQSEVLVNLTTAEIQHTPDRGVVRPEASGVGI
jgi:PRC-barrel domain